MARDELLKIYCDGGSRGNPGPAASAFVVINSEGKSIFHQGYFLGNATNNQAEYNAVLFALKWLSVNSPNTEVIFYLDSLLVVSQLSGKYKVKSSDLLNRNREIKNLISNYKLKISDFIYIPREQNSAADSLVNLTLDQH